MQEFNSWPPALCREARSAEPNSGCLARCDCLLYHPGNSAAVHGSRTISTASYQSIPMIFSLLRKGSARWHGYAVAIVGVLICTAARELLEPLLGSQALLLPYVLAVLPSAWIGGVGPGLAATGLSVVTAIGVFGIARLPGGGNWIDTETHVALFAFEATLIVALTSAVRRSRDTAAAHSQAKDALLAAVS